MATEKTETPTPEQLQAELQAMQEAKSVEFNKKYVALCQEYEMQMFPIIEIVPGNVPTAKMVVQSVPKQG